MKQFSFIALGVVLLAIDTYAGMANAQDAPSPPAPVAIPTTAPHGLPPIFAPGNQILLTGRTFTEILIIREVQGEWIFANSPGQNPAWIRPASIDGTWSLSR